MKRLGLCFLLFIPASARLTRADWPTYRHDSQRSACTSEALAGLLRPAWRRQLPAHQIAFANEPRQQFDESYEPVCADGIVVVGSPADGSVRAFSLSTGTQRWVHWTEAPVRLAPVLHSGKVYVGSDDGRFTCLDLGDGRVLWQTQAFPRERPDLRLLGNNRLISMWPVRGGPVVADGVVYFGAGVWPTAGVYVHALDAASGKPVWSNDRLSYLDNVRIDHNKRYDAGASPQGYLLVSGEHLVVPNGRSQPIALNRADGTLFHFVQGYRNGDCHVAIGGDYAFVGQNGVVNLTDFREVGSKWVTQGKDAPETFVPGKFDQFEGPYHPYKRFAACDARSVFDGDVAYGMASGVLYAYDLSKSAVSEYEQAQGAQTLKPFRWDAPLLMRVPVGLSGDTRLFVKAGGRLYGRAGNAVVAIELTGGTPAAKVVWNYETQALPTSAIAAGGRLIVALQDGTLLCLADIPEGQAVAAEDAPTAEAPEPLPPPSPAVRALLTAVSARQGFLVVGGSLSPAEADCLLADTELRLLVVAEDQPTVEALRELYAGRGQYGTRFEAFRGKAYGFGLPAYLASILWLRGEHVGVPSIEQLRGLWRAVRPFGGALCFTGTPEQCADIARFSQAAALPDAVAKPGAGCFVLSRPTAPEGSADWTHETSDAARTFFSQDTCVRPPLAPLWFGDGPGHGFFKNKDYGRGVKPQVTAGRVFALQQFSASLYAYDAYTGRVLWRQAGGDAGRITRYAAMPDGVYAGVRGQCVVYDPATGRELRTLDFRQAVGAESVAQVTGLAVTPHSVLVAVSHTQVSAIEAGLWDADVLVCLDRRDGTARWQREAQERFTVKALAAGDGHVFCTDSMSPLANERWQRRGGEAKECTVTVLALDEMTGAVEWQVQGSFPYRHYGASAWLSVRGRDDWLAYAAGPSQVLFGREGTAMLLSAGDGTVLWKKPLGLSQPVVLMGERFMDQGARLFDLATAEVVQSDLFQRGGCNYAVATPLLALLRDQTVCYVELDGGKRHRLRNMRSGCSNSLIAACGILSIPNFARQCVCNYPVQTSSAWIHMPGIELWGGVEAERVEPLRLGPDIARIDPEQAEAMHAFERRFLVEDAGEAAKHLLGQWTFDATVEGRPDHAPDGSGRGAHCRLSNPAFETRGGGKALRCGSDTSKTSGQASIGPKGVVREAVTMSAWVKLGDRQHKGATGIVERPQFYRLMVDDTEPPYAISFTTQNESKRWLGARTPRCVKPGEWVHVAGTFDGEAGEARIYLNGTCVGKSSGTAGRIPDVSGAVYIGVRDGGAFLNGALDDVRIYDRALSAKVVEGLATEAE